MRKILILALSGLFCSYAAVEACAADDVYVDLSVLNEIGHSSSSGSTYVPTFAPSYIPDVVRTEPQFPVVKKRATRPAVKKAVKPAKKTVAKKVMTATKKPVKKAAPVKKQGLKIKQISVKDKEEKINIPSKPADAATGLKTALVSREFIADVDNGPFKAEVKGASDKVSSAPIVPVKSGVIEVLDIEPATVPTASMDVAVPEAKEVETPEVKAPEAPEAKAPEAKEALLDDKLGMTVMPPVSAQIVTETSAVVAPDVSIPETPKEAEPLIPVATPSVDVEKVKREVVFAEGSAELDETAKANIDMIIAAFEDAKVNKIAIMAYNYDNGQDVFRKKRQSLNRAIEIRSYLLGKGYKNFSIKVINISDDASRGNVVEIEEIK